MRQSKISIVTIIITGFIVLHGSNSCKKSEEKQADPLSDLNLPSTPYNYARQELPGYFLTSSLVLDNTPVTNPVSDWGATLGRVLFYDKTLSLNNTVSCASCHQQQYGFADNHAFSTGFAGELTKRNSMSLTNARYFPAGKFFWDQRSGPLEVWQTLMPIENPVEMGLGIDELIKRLEKKPYYPYLFDKAFSDQSIHPINRDAISKALAQFIRSMISYQSKYDAGRSQIVAPQNPAESPYPNFTAQENLGKQLFFNPYNGCAGCHRPETFTILSVKNNGLENPSVDRGVGGFTNIPSQVGLFKVPSLKNIELSAPYMHDGRFATLEEVVEHYNSGIQPHPNLSPELKNPDGSPKRLNLTVSEKAALVAFLKTLTDVANTTDVKFSNPFK